MLLLVVCYYEDCSFEDMVLVLFFGVLLLIECWWVVWVLGGCGVLCRCG